MSNSTPSTSSSAMPAGTPHLSLCAAGENDCREETEVRAALDRYGVEDSGHRHLHKAVDMKDTTNHSIAEGKGNQAKWNPIGLGRVEGTSGNSRKRSDLNKHLGTLIDHWNQGMTQQLSRGQAFE
ncbi:hypothetical protein Bbelb_049570 [Branchiostoma belcheri]|nr:hypothetical protein Bbelb_049570 [Branchiostoma belcheri]